MLYCKNNLKKTYTGKEPSPKGLGYCASGEKEGTEMKGLDGNMWVKKDGRWKKKEPFYEKLINKLYKWWVPLSLGQIIVIYQDGKHKLIASSMKTNKAKSNEIMKKWKEFDEDKEVKSIIWSAQSTDAIHQFVKYLIKKSTKKQLEEFIQMKNLPNYLLENYKKYFKKDYLFGNKDYHFK
jgi:hypothetical protein